MFCSNCGAQINENSRFCENCGYSVESTQNNVIYNANNENTNPYANVSTPVQNTYNQPQNIYFVPQAPAEPTHQPQQNFPNTPPQYLRPVQTPNGVQYMPVEPVVTVKKPEPEYNPFVFVSASIMGLMFILCFIPWFTANGDGFNLFQVFSQNIYLERFEMDATAACSLLMLVTMGLLIPSFILAFVRKNRMPAGLSIAASAITLFTLFLLVVLIADSTGDVEATGTPLALFVLSVANIIFPIVARKAK